MPVGERPGAWAAFVAAEGLRVEDLDPRPGRDVVRALACALVDAKLKQIDVETVTREDQRQISRWWGAFRRAAVTDKGLGSGNVTQADMVPRPKSPKALAAEILAEAAAAARVPESGLILAETQLEPLSTFLSEYQEGLANGGTVGPAVDVRLKRIHRVLVNAAGTVQVFAQQRGIRL